MQSFYNQRMDDIRIALNTAHHSVSYILDRTNPTLEDDLKIFTENSEASLNDLLTLEYALYSHQKNILPNSVAFTAIENIILIIKTYLHDFQIGNTLNLDQSILSSSIANIIKTNVAETLNNNFYASNSIGASALASDLLASIRTNTGSTPDIDPVILASYIEAFPGGATSASASILSSINSIGNFFNNEILAEKINVFSQPSLNFVNDVWAEFYYQYAQADLVNFANMLALKIKDYDDTINFSSSGISTIASSLVNFEILVSNTYQIIGDYAYLSDISDINSAIADLESLISEISQIIDNYAYQSEVILVSQILSSSIENVENNLLSLEESLSNYVQKSNVQLGQLGSLYSCPSLNAAASDITLIASGSADIGQKLKEMQKCNNWAYKTEFYTFPDLSIVKDNSLPNVYVTTDPSLPCFDCVGGFFLPELPLSSFIFDDLTSGISITNIPINCENDSCYSTPINLDVFIVNIQFPSIEFTCASGICSSEREFLDCQSQESYFVQCSTVDYETSLVIPSLTASAVPPTAGSLATFCQYQLDHELED